MYPRLILIHSSLWFIRLWWHGEHVLFLKCLNRSLTFNILPLELFFVPLYSQPIWEVFLEGNENALNINSTSCYHWQVKRMLSSCKHINKLLWEGTCMSWGGMMGMFWEKRWSLKWRARGSEDDWGSHGKCKWRRRAGVLVWRRRMASEMESGSWRDCCQSGLSQATPVYRDKPGTTWIWTDCLIDTYSV